MPDIVNSVQPQSSVYQQIEFHLGCIMAMFAQPQVTLIVRSRALEAPVIMTNEQDPNDILNAVKQHCGVRPGLIKVGDVDPVSR